MTGNNQTTVVGVFPDRWAARQAVAELKRVGFRDDQIGVVARGHDETDRAAGSRVAEGAGVGAATGAGIGALWALGIAAGVLPVIGPVVAGGLLMSVIASAGGAAAVGTLVGALIGLGVPEEEAKYYQGEFEAGRTLVTVRAEGRTGEARDVLHRFGAYDHESSTTAAGVGGRI